jgi:hypothetical protein
MRKLIWIAAAAGVFGCAEIEDDATIDQDSLTVIPIGPGTEPDAVAPPDTPQSRSEDREQRSDGALPRR